MFADLGHFNIRAIQVPASNSCIVSLFSCNFNIVSCYSSYMGQAAYLRKFPENVADTFFKSIPGTAEWSINGLIICSSSSKQLYMCKYKNVRQS